MSEFEYWRLCERLSIVQAALLIAGFDPADIQVFVEGWSPEVQPTGYAACRQALIGAIEEKQLKGYLHYKEWSDLNHEPQRTLFLQDSYVQTEGIADWLRTKGMRKGFFLPEDDIPKEYMDPEHHRFAPKLAAAVRAWHAAGSDVSLKGTPKQKIEKWLRLNAAEFGLIQKDGKPIESAIKAIAQIANWKPEGGPPATPVKQLDAALTKEQAESKVVAMADGRAQKLKRFDRNGGPF
ncbi:MAG: hypothetical protein AAB227_08010 [Pseudomonadota bacterium]